ncbi:helix-turn-helix transcriptional regulator [Micromonospora sp. NPDC002575]|uniref:helix-turn-helix transcriptional regulator n=1 Tax=Micromonospora sp. NPDC002575 TaxID=3364222 RepID=UPI0036926F2F
MVNQRYARHIGIVQQLRSKNWISATALATRFDASVRTIYRDIEELNTAGLPIESVAGREGGYRLSAESPVDSLIMDADDVLRLYVLRQVARIGQVAHRSCHAARRIRSARDRRRYRWPWYPATVCSNSRSASP